MNQTNDTSKWYEEGKGLFGPEYLEEYKETLTDERTLADVVFLEKELHLQPGMKILDLCCGHGRHAVELAKRGYAVTGQDINQFFLDKAKESAEQAKVQVRWVRGDMREIPFEGEFDVVVNMFTAFGYLENDEEDQKVFHAAARALKNGGRFLVDVINRDRIMRVFSPQDGVELADKSVMVTERKFDFVTSRNNERRLRVWPDGKRKDHSLSLRMYSLHELVKMCAVAGLQYESSFGNNDSSAFDFTSMRCILIAKKE